MSQFISYRINTSGTVPALRAESRESEGGSATRHYSVVRRFNDFVWLHNQLSTKYRGFLIPPLPDKAIIGRFSDGFIDERKRALEIFLSRLVHHPSLSQSHDLHLFLTADQETFSKAKSEKEEAGKKLSKGIMAIFKESMQSFSNQFGGGKDRDKSSEDLLCEKVMADAEQLQLSLTSILNNMDSILNRTKGLANTWLDFSVSCSALANYEGQQNEANMAVVFSKLSICAERLTVLLTQKRDTESVYMLENFKDHIRIVRSVEQMLKTRGAVLLSYQTSLSELENQQASLSRVQGLPGKEEKALAQEKAVVEAQQRVDVDLAELRTVTANCLAEAKRYQLQKHIDMKFTVANFVRLQIEHSKKLQATWEALLPDIDNA